MEEQYSIILFDGVCNLCNGFVNFVIDRDEGAHFRFAALQSKAGEELMQKYLPKDNNLESIVLIENGIAYKQSMAALRISRNLSGGWRLLYGFMIVPPFIRNVVYRIVAKYRYRWFGKQDTCRVPTPDLAKRFL